MTETSSYVRMGVTFIVLASVLVTLFCLWGIAGAANTEYYEEQVTTINGTDSELADLYNAHIPVVQILNQVEASNYYLNLQQIVVSYAQRTDGKLTSLNKKTYTDINKCNDEWSTRIGYIENIGVTPAGSYIIYMRVGG